MVGIKIKGIEVTVEEAKIIYAELDNIFGSQAVITVYPTQPTIPWYPAQPQEPWIGYPPHITYAPSDTCGDIH